MIKYKVYIGGHLLMTTDSYLVACRHAKAGKKVMMVNV